MRRRPIVVLSLLLTTALLVSAAPPPVQGRDGLVAADHHAASQAGAQVLAQGGNAADAAVAAALAAGVVQPAGSGLGGGGFAVVVDGETRDVLDFREVAPSAGHADMFLDDQGQVIEGASRKGGLAVGVPGEARGLAQLLDEHGTMSPRQVAAPAVALAKKGFPLGHHLQGALERTPAMLVLLDGVSSLPDPGTRVRRQALSRTLHAWGKSDGQALNEGPIADQIVAAVQDAGGVMTAQDLADYQPVHRTPLVGTYRGYTIVTMPPPSSGGAVLLQVLAVLEGYDVASLGHNSGDHLHLLAEAFQHAYADRAEFMGDPDFVDVPLDRMLDPARVLEIRAQIWPGRTFDRGYYGSDAGIPDDAGTQHISVIDGSGMAVALTTTINTSFGSEVWVPGAGMVLNNQMDDFIAKPGVANAYGLVGKESNAVQPGKKPLSSMSPTIVLDPDGNVVMAVGASGGPLIISGTLQVLSNVLDFGMDPEDAVSAPRMHHQWVPEAVQLDVGIPQDVHQDLIGRGHQVREWSHFSSVQLVTWGDAQWSGASDPRKGGRPAGPGAF